ncbi:PAS domain-containing protein [Flavobacterium crassostreae]|uniref:Histidine kinase n=1 Tax=Flavobacterium crassostreae TaxID=1763534 RepID=A0A1B9E5R9_9FLAO|nr:PAS domain-containing protein [Flavobacterium crassostreae]OCB77314.1 histidine kinase [Flavobacterium crassostreae]
MIHLKDYDNGVAKFHQEFHLNATPLFSWNFYGTVLQQLRNANLDTQKIDQIAATFKWESANWELKKALYEDVIVVTDPALKIVFSSQNMVKMNGYKAEEVVGKTPRMFQGKDTCIETSKEIKIAIQKQLPFEKKVLNYKKNGDPYYCIIKGFPIFNKKGFLSHFIAFEKTA